MSSNILVSFLEKGGLPQLLNATPVKILVNKEAFSRVIEEDKKLKQEIHELKLNLETNHANYTNAVQQLTQLYRTLREEKASSTLTLIQDYFTSLKTRKPEIEEKVNQIKILQQQLEKVKKEKTIMLAKLYIWNGLHFHRNYFTEDVLTIFRQARNYMVNTDHSDDDIVTYSKNFIENIDNKYDDKSGVLQTLKKTFLKSIQYSSPEPNKPDFKNLLPPNEEIPTSLYPEIISPRSVHHERRQLPLQKLLRVYEEETKGDNNEDTVDALLNYQPNYQPAQDHENKRIAHIKYIAQNFDMMTLIPEDDDEQLSTNFREIIKQLLLGPRRQKFDGESYPIGWTKEFNHLLPKGFELPIEYDNQTVDDGLAYSEPADKDEKSKRDLRNMYVEQSINGTYKGTDRLPRIKIEKSDNGHPY